MKRKPSGKPGGARPQSTPPSEETLHLRLENGCQALGIALPPGAADRLLAFMALLRKWNRVYNLTAIDDPILMVDLHLLDCLAALPHVKGRVILDAGSGAGLPGLVFAIANPDLHCLLIDNNGKKVRFLIQAGIELGLSNITSEKIDLRDYRPPREVDVVISRAFKSAEELLGMTTSLHRPGLLYLLMKGTRPEQELPPIALPGREIDIIRIEIPGLHQERHLIRLALA